MNNSSNILNIIPTYNHSSLEGTILDLKKELKEQKQVNELLKSEDYSKKTEKILNFVSRNEGEIDDQIERLNEVIVDLKLIINENNNLEKEENKFGDLIESPNCIRMADKLLKLKALKRDIQIFLEETGIVTHPV